MNSAAFLRSVTITYFTVYTGIKVLFIFSGYDLFTEEAQYWLWSRYPDWSYYSKPPMIAWVNYATNFLGHHDSVIRFTALAFGMASLFMMYRLTMLLFGEVQVALLSSVLLSVTPFFILASTFFTTDSLLLFFWIVTGFHFIRAIQSEAMKNWAWAGFFFGLGCLSKYSMLFFLLALLPVGMIRNGKRHLTGILTFLFIGAIMCTPVVIWNYQHDWVTFRHVSALSFQGGSGFSISASLRYLSEYIGGLLLINSPFLLYILFRSKAVFRDFSPEGKRVRRILIWLLVPVAGTVAVFFMISVFKRTEVNWGAMSYVSLPIIMAWVTHQSLSYPTSIRLAALTLFCTVGLLFPAALDKLGLSTLLPLQIDSMKRMAGWEQLSQHVGTIARQYPQPPLIVTDSYHVASEIAFYGGFERILCINSGRRMNQFDIWSGSAENSTSGRTALYVTELTDLPAALLQYDGVNGQYSFPVAYRGKVIRTFHIFVLTNFRGRSDTQVQAY